jgi:hypothetical protein
MGISKEAWEPLKKRVDYKQKSYSVIHDPLEDIAKRATQPNPTQA